MKSFLFREERLFLLFLLPSLVGVLIFYLIPFAASIYLAVVDNPVMWNFVGLKNFKEVFLNGAFQLSLKNTAAFFASCIPLNIVIPLFLALALKNARVLKSICGVIFLLPLVIPSASIVYFWKSLFSVNGLLNGMFFADAPVNWLNTDYSRIIVLVVFIWKNAGYNMVLFLAALDFIPSEYYECSMVEGAGKIRRFFSVTLIYLTPTFFLVLIMSVINSFKSFKEIYLLTGNYPHSSIYMLQHYMNNQFVASNYQRLAAASYILSAVIVAVVVAIFLMQNKIAKDF